MRIYPKGDFSVCLSTDRRAREQLNMRVKVVDGCVFQHARLVGDNHLTPHRGQRLLHAAQITHAIVD